MTKQDKKPEIEMVDVEVLAAISVGGVYYPVGSRVRLPRSVAEAQDPKRLKFAPAEKATAAPADRQITEGDSITK